jgi:hypothetical protein
MEHCVQRSIAAAQGGKRGQARHVAQVPDCAVRKESHCLFGCCSEHSTARRAAQ